MSVKSIKALSGLDAQIAHMKSYCPHREIVLRMYQDDHASVVKDRSAKKYKLGSDEDKEFTAYRGYPITVTARP